MRAIREVSELRVGRARLGESPVWDERSQGLYWVDILGGNIHYWVPGGDGHLQTWNLGQQIGCIALRRDAHGLIAGLEASVSLISLHPLAIHPIAHPEAASPGNRCNDGKCDKAGRFWVGTCDRALEHATGWLYRLDTIAQLERVAGPFTCTNGPAFSATGRTLYCVDSPARAVFALALDAAGRLLETRLFLQFSDPSWGYPDGVTCDVEGCLWIAHWGGGRVSRFGPNGRLIESIRVPASQVTSCAFGGADWKTLFISSAATGLSAEEVARTSAGAIFAVDVDVPGAPTDRFAG
jgi:sugar lactone lactonase YvrE